MVGRIIFANLLELPLEKYKRFIEEVEESLIFDKIQIEFNKLSKAKVSNKVKEASKVVAKIVRSGKNFSISYTYGGFNKIYAVCAVSPLTHKLRRISSRNLLTHKILKEVIKYQRRYLETGDPIDLVALKQVQLPLDNSWTSRLVSRISIITPSGEEKPLKWFFQTQKDINKRLIKQLLDKENKQIESGRLKRPLTDNQIRTKLEDKYGIRLFRHSIGLCRKDMGIPPANRRLSGYKYPPLLANFSMSYPFVFESVTKHAPAKSGVYELSLKRNTNHDPRTTIFYIGSAKNIRKRLMEHLRGNNKNGLIKKFLKKYECSFRHVLVSKGWQEEEKRLYKLFAATYGSGPRCNRVQPGGSNENI